MSLIEFVEPIVRPRAKTDGVRLEELENKSVVQLHILL